MYRIDSLNSVTPVPGIAVPGTSGFFEDGLATGTPPGTFADQDWWNMLQESFLHLLADQGISHDKADYEQLAEAISSKIAAEASLPSPATTALAGLLEFAAFPETGYPADPTKALSPPGIADNAIVHGAQSGAILFAMDDDPNYWEIRWGLQGLVEDGDLLLFPLGRFFEVGTWNVWVSLGFDNNSAEKDVRGIPVGGTGFTVDFDVAEGLIPPFFLGTTIRYFAIGRNQFP